jgi:tellurite resistance protein
MIIFGTRGVTTTPNSGEFHCPSCRLAGQYKHKRVRRFFTLYFIPLIPLDKVGEYVECKECKGTFNLDVLEWDPESSNIEFEAEFQTAIKKVMIHMLLADGEVDDAEVETAIDVYQKVAGMAIDPQSFRNEIEQVQTQHSSLADSLAAVQGNLNDEGKEMVLQAALLVAMADGEFQQEEQDLIEVIGHGLGMSKAHVHGVINSA